MFIFQIVGGLIMLALGVSGLTLLYGLLSGPRPQHAVRRNLRRIK